MSIPSKSKDSEKPKRAPPIKKQVARYYELVDKINYAKERAGLYGVVLDALESLPLLGALIKHRKRECGSFDIKYIPALDDAYMVTVVNNMEKEAKQLKDAVAQHKELEPWRKKFIEIEKLRDVVEYVKKNSGCLHKDLKFKFDVDQMLITECVECMASSGIIRRFKSGVSYKLVLTSEYYRNR